PPASSGASIDSPESQGGGTNKLTFQSPTTITADGLCTLLDSSTRFIPNSCLEKIQSTDTDLTDGWDFGGSSGFEIPNGTAPTVDAIGEIAIDTTAAGGQIVYFEDSAVNVITPLDSDCVSLENLSELDDNYFFDQFPEAVHVTGVSCRCWNPSGGGCGTPATFTLEDEGGGAMTITGTNPTCAINGAGHATFAAVTAGNDLAVGEAVRFDVTNTPTTGDNYMVCVQYTKDRQ
ncbi:MAG: hypothetical protein ACREBE_11085, partial [bacterium]